MAGVFFKKSYQQRIFKTRGRKRKFTRLSIENQAVRATNPVDPTIDPRLTRIPVYVNPGCAVSINFAGESVSTDGFYWLWPDGTEEHDTQTTTFIAPAGQGRSIVYLMMKEGYTVEDIWYSSYGGYLTPGDEPQVAIKTEDLYYLSSISSFMHSYLRSSMEGDVKYLANAFQSPNLRYWWINITNDSVCLYGDVGNLGPLVNGYGYVRFYRQYQLYGSLSFADDCPCANLFFYECFGFSPENISQTLVNWDACNAASFSRDFLCTTVKRSELTAEGEAAVLSLIAKGCSFTFEAE